jgi:CheY-like chemotaxis protein
MRKHTILWADDDPDDLLLMREILVKNEDKFNLIEVHDGKEALSFLDQAKADHKLPCLIILDINMPILDGKEALTRIKKDPALQDIPVVMFTTSNSELDKLFCQKMGTKMVTKPPSYTVLENTISGLLRLCV